ncbi:ferritin family protein, partial [Calditrichota bacterium]
GHQTMLESIKEMELYDGSIPIQNESIFESGKSSHGNENDFSKTIKIEDVLSIALKREFRAKAIFEKMAETTINNELKTIFTKLAEEEQIHHQNITKKFSLRQGEMGYEM